MGAGFDRWVIRIHARAARLAHRWDLPTRPQRSNQVGSRASRTRPHPALQNRRAGSGRVVFGYRWRATPRHRRTTGPAARCRSTQSLHRASLRELSNQYALNTLSYPLEIQKLARSSSLPPRVGVLSYFYWDTTESASLHYDRSLDPLSA